MVRYSLNLVMNGLTRPREALDKKQRMYELYLGALLRTKSEIRLKYRLVKRSRSQLAQGLYSLQPPLDLAGAISISQ